MNLPIGSVEKEELNLIWFVTPGPRPGLRMFISCSNKANSSCLHGEHLAHVTLRWKEDAEQLLAKLKAMKNHLALHHNIKPNS